jgi:hypothetical protein
MFAGEDSTRPEVVSARSAIDQPAESVLELAQYTKCQKQRAASGTYLIILHGTSKVKDLEMKVFEHP